MKLLTLLLPFALAVFERSHSQGPPGQQRSVSPRGYQSEPDSGLRRGRVLPIEDMMQQRWEGTPKNRNDPDGDLEQAPDTDSDEDDSGYTSASEEFDEEDVQSKRVGGLPDEYLRQDATAQHGYQEEADEDFEDGAFIPRQESQVPEDYESNTNNVQGMQPIPEIDDIGSDWFLDGGALRKLFDLGLPLNGTQKVMFVNLYHSIAQLNRRKTKLWGKMSYPVVLMKPLRMLRDLVRSPIDKKALNEAADKFLQNLNSKTKDEIEQSVQALGDTAGFWKNDIIKVLKDEFDIYRIDQTKPLKSYNWWNPKNKYHKEIDFLKVYGGQYGNLQKNQNTMVDYLWTWVERNLREVVRAALRKGKSESLAELSMEDIRQNNFDIQLKMKLQLNKLKVEQVSDNEKEVLLTQAAAKAQSWVEENQQPAQRKWYQLWKPKQSVVPKVQPLLPSEDEEDVFQEVGSEDAARGSWWPFGRNQAKYLETDDEVLPAPIQGGEDPKSFLSKEKGQQSVETSDPDEESGIASEVKKTNWKLPKFGLRRKAKPVLAETHLQEGEVKGWEDFQSDVPTKYDQAEVQEQGQVSSKKSKWWRWGRQSKPEEQPIEESVSEFSRGEFKDPAMSSMKAQDEEVQKENRWWNPKSWKLKRSSKKSQE